MSLLAERQFEDRTGEQLGSISLLTTVAVFRSDAFWGLSGELVLLCGPGLSRRFHGFEWLRDAQIQCMFWCMLAFDITVTLPPQNVSLSELL